MRVRRGVGLLLAFVIPACGGGSGGSAPDVIPDPPTGVSATPLGATRATVLWTPAGVNAAEFIIEKSPDSVVWAEAHRAGFASTSAIVSGLTPGAQVFFRVRASNAKGASAPAGTPMITLVQPAWTPLAAGPGDRYWTCSAYDPGRRRMYIFGGRDTGLTVHNTLHAFHLDTLTWSLVTPVNALPQPRLGASMIYDSLNDRLIIFGGRVGMPPTDVTTSEILEYRLASNLWAILGTSSGGPTARQHHTAVYDSLHRRMVVYGGENAGFQTPEVMALSLPSAGLPAWSTFPLAGGGPLARTRHSAVYDPGGQRMIVFGGSDNDLGDGSVYAQDVWSLDLSDITPLAWTPLTPAGGPPFFRDGHVAAWDSVNNVMIVFGGADDSATPNDEVWALSFDGAPRWSAYAPASGAAARYYATGVFDPVNVALVVYGGALDDILIGTDDAWSLDF